MTKDKIARMIVECAAQRIEEMDLEELLGTAKYEQIVNDSDHQKLNFAEDRHRRLIIGIRQLWEG